MEGAADLPMAVRLVAIDLHQKSQQFVCRHRPTSDWDAPMLSLSIRDSVHCFSSSVPRSHSSPIEIAALASVAASDKPEYISQEIL